MATYSVRCTNQQRGETFWLASKKRPAWMYEENRVRFDTQEQAEATVKKLFGPDYNNYGIFPNSVDKPRALEQEFSGGVT